ncbi:MAG: Disaggregatase related protein [Candidatus Bathyarchaeota archaeon B26-1]|nr:MAG: Disaggregatase related protein [Candidatus Bathyarchaeota archaeon B26-1]
MHGSVKFGALLTVILITATGLLYYFSPGRMEAAAEGKGVITGVVKDENGAPLRGVNVVCEGSSVTTNDKGEFSFEGLSEGRHLIKAYKQGYMIGVKDVEVEKDGKASVEIFMKRVKRRIVVATDGTGDYNCDGVNDEYEINAAIESLSRIGGGTVHLKEGNYIIDGSVVLAHNIIFEGEGQDRTYIKLKDWNNREYWGLFVLDRVSNVTVKDFTLDGNKHRQRVSKGIDSDIDGFRTSWSHDIVIQRVKLMNLWTDGFQFVHSDDCVVEDSSVIQAGHDGFMLIYCEKIKVINSYVYASGTGNAGIRLYECSFCLVERNYFNVYGFGILINPQGGVPCGNNVYKYNIMYGNYRDTPAIAIYARGTPIENELFIGNIIVRSVYHGVRLLATEEGGSSIKNVTFINNVIYGAKRSGIILEGKTKSITNILVKNCIIANNGEYGIYGKVTSIYNNVWNNGKGNYEGGAKPGVGDISVDPLFADPTRGDFHLKSEAGRWDPNQKRWVKDSVTSPCIDAGDPSSDFSKEPEPNGGRINMGAYGNTGEASKSLKE